MQPAKRYRRADELRLTGRVDSVHRKGDLGEIDTDEYYCHGISPSADELMRNRASHRVTWLPHPATARVPRDVEVPCIR